MTAAFTRLSPESRYQRFFAPVERLSESDLTYLTEIDHRDHEALVAIDPEDGGLVGVARYVCTSRLGEGDGSGKGTLKPAAVRGGGLKEAEVAVIVGDPWQGKGLATALLERLARRASEEGVDYFLALVLERRGRQKAEEHLMGVTIENEQRRQELREQHGIVVAGRDYAVEEDLPG